jgi:1,4-alpha-glucan branching enzyme
VSQKAASTQVATKPVKFRITATPGCKIFVAGTFNNWDPRQLELKEKTGVFGATMPLPLGRHEYKFVIDGVWCVDPECTEWVPNSLGSLNSVVTVA